LFYNYNTNEKFNAHTVFSQETKLITWQFSSYTKKRQTLQSVKLS